MILTPHFSINEFQCHDGTPVPEELIPNCKALCEQLEILRTELGCSIHINSGYRTKEYNAKQHGSATNSQHLQAKAADITTSKYTPSQIHAIIERLIKEGKMHDGGLGWYDTFIHYDVRPTHARWDFRKNK